MPRGLAFRGVDKADSFGGDEKTNGYAGFAEKTFEAGLRRSMPTAFLRLRACLVQVGPPRKFFNEDQVLWLAFASTDNPSGVQRFAVFGKAG